MKPPRAQEAARASAALELLELDAPLCRSSRIGLNEWAVQRMWENIRGRASGGSPVARVRARARQHAKWGWALALGLLIAGWLAAGQPWRTRVFQGPLVTIDGQRFESLDAPLERAARVGFADGSQIEAAPGTRIEGLAATSSEFVLLLRRGRARFSVTPGGPRRWLIEARGASVEVVGTRLSVESGVGFVAVGVESGVVLVRSALLADGVQRLGAGQALRLDTGTNEDVAAPSARTPGDARAPAAEARAERASAVPSEPRAVEPPASLPPHLDRSRTAQRRWHGNAAELWSGADRARRAGDAARAAELLERLLAEHPEDSQAALGAYTLGVLQLEQLARPRAAARRFQQAMDLGIAAGLRESCYLRWAEALHQAGDGNALRSVAREYLRSYPLGEQRDTMQRLLEQRSLGGKTPHPDLGSSLPSSGESPK